MSDCDITREFLVESGENLDRLDRDLVSLEQNPGDREALAAIFRTIHTIKGACGFLGFNKLEKLAHAGENLLSRLRDGQLALAPEITTALLSLVDAVRQMLREIAANGNDGQDDYQALCATLSALQDGKAAPVPEQAASRPQPRPEPPPEVEPPTKKARVSSRKPAQGKLGGVLVERGLIQPEDLVRALEEQERGDRRRIGEILVSMGLAKPEDVLAAQRTLDARTREAAPETVRVGVQLLDRLMTLVGELVLARNQLLQLSYATQNGKLQKVSQRLDLIATELQEDVMRTRMQPIGNVWAQFPRTVRDVAVACGKQVEVVMDGKETELDRTIIEAIKDPLTHLVRNSVDHGIEAPEKRLAAGKSAVGRLTLRAYHAGGQVNIEIMDDGAGLDKERIRRKGIERGLITAEQAASMGETEIFALIFQPGFSTAEQVTNVSGRGVGMDVVKTNVEKIGGSVDIYSRAGKGTTVRVKIPLTLAIIPALEVLCCGERYAIPQINLMELVRLEGERLTSGIEMVRGAPIYRLRGKLLPLVYLGRELGLSGPSQREQIVNIVVLQADDTTFGLVVDQVCDTEEIVVKPLRKQLKSVGVFAGSTIMGDGKVALILDVLGLAQRAHVITDGPRQASVESVNATLKNDRQPFLIFAGAGDSRMAIPLNSLARLEEIPVAQVEMSGRLWVTQYRGKILPLLRLNRVMTERRKHLQSMPELPNPNAGPLNVLVLQHDAQTFGLVVGHIIDIVEDRADVRSPATRPAVLYSVVIAERVTELLDISALAASLGVERQQADASRGIEAVN